MDDYFAEYPDLGIDAHARSSALFMVTEEPGVWTVRQILDDPAGDQDWGITAQIDLAASDEAGEPVVHLVDVGPA